MILSSIRSVTHPSSSVPRERDTHPRTRLDGSGAPHPTCQPTLIKLPIPHSGLCAIPVRPHALLLARQGTRVRGAGCRTAPSSRASRRSGASHHIIIVFCRGRGGRAGAGVTASTTATHARCCMSQILPCPCRILFLFPRPAERRIRFTQRLHPAVTCRWPTHYPLLSRPFIILSALSLNPPCPLDTLQDIHTPVPSIDTAA